MTRILTAVFGLALVIGVVGLGPAWLFVVVAAAVSALALDEFLALDAARRGGRVGRWFLLIGAGVTASFALDPGAPVWALALGVLILLTAALARSPGATADRVMGGATGLAYVSILMGFLVLLPRDALFPLLGIVWAGDTGAYYGGRLLGRRRLAPVISPAKTVEGAAAGALASLAAGVLLMRVSMQAEWTPILTGVVLLTAAAGQVGDLAESALKRAAGVKDSSRRLPGHGGVLDRIDSLLFAGPVFHMCLPWLR